MNCGGQGTFIPCMHNRGIDGCAILKTAFSLFLLSVISPERLGFLWTVYKPAYDPLKSKFSHNYQLKVK
jgi:hypothetical protein